MLRIPKRRWNWPESGNNSKECYISTSESKAATAFMCGKGRWYESTCTAVKKFPGSAAFPKRRCVTGKNWALFYPHHPTGEVRFDFRGLAAFRAVKKLRDQGIPLHAVRQCLRKLNALLPQVEQPLCQVRLECRGRQVVILRIKSNRRPKDSWFWILATPRPLPSHYR